MPLLFAALVTITVTLVLFYVSKKTKFKDLPSFVKQSIYGLFFGLAAVCATELGSVELAGAAVNVRDAAPVTAGLLFGPWAGILAGLIGAFDRYFIASPIFGIGLYTQLACSTATLFAGCFSAFFKAFVFKKHRPLVIHAFVFILVTEVIHMCLILLTHLDDLYNATAVAHACFLPLLLANSAVIVVVFLVTSFLEQIYKGYTIKELFTDRSVFSSRDMTFSFQFGLLTTLVVAFTACVIVVAFFINMNGLFSANQRFASELDSITQFIQIDSQRYQKSIKDMSVEYADDWTVENITIYTVADNDGHIYSKNYNQQEIVDNSFNNPSDTIYTQNCKGVNYYVMYKNIDDLRIILQIEDRYQMFLPHLTLLLSSFALILIFGLVMLLVFLILRKVVNQNLDKLNRSLEAMSHGIYENQDNNYSQDIFSKMSDNLNYTVGTLKENIQKEATKYDAEFELAHEIQISALPNAFPAFPHESRIDVYADYRSAREVGGDFYDYYYVDKDKICFVIADVSGKGIPAAMFMMRAKSALMMFARNTKDPAETLFEVNNYLCENNIAGMFVTCWVGILDLNNGELKYSSAGHNPPYLISSDGKNVDELTSKRFLVLGAFENTKYENSEYEMKTGEILTLYTDGVTEANNTQSDLYGEDRLQKYLATCSGKSLKEICDDTLSDVDSFVSGAEQFDDITILTFKYR